MRSLSPALVVAVLATLLPVAVPAAHGPGGLSLPGGLRLNGRFDVVYERWGYTDDPSDGEDALTNYHHFVFLSRDGGEKDPFFFTAELVDLSFYEVGAAFRPARAWRLQARAGKILVPFGPEPLFHHAYGGLSGFDQAVLPTVWAQHGLSGQFQVRLGPLRLSNDLYVVHGHGSKEADDVLDLKTGLSKASEVRVAAGDRLGLGWGPLSLWYSAYVNPLGHDRLLFLQALDLKLWRWPDVTFLEDLALELGVLRADVSGGGKGRDYYHLASYLTLRYYPAQWVYLQYRGGLFTYNNRRGFIVDETRLDERDRSSHNAGVVFRWHGVSLGATLFFNLEKRNEQDNDLLRLQLSYAF